MAKRLFVGGLPYSVTDTQIKEMFAVFGEIVSCNVIVDRVTNNSKGFGFVEMEDDADADKAMKKLDGTEVEGRKIVVNEARPRPERSESNYRQRSSYSERRYPQRSER